MLTGRAPSDPYVSAQFEKYLKEELNTLPKHMVDRRIIRDILIRIYATPVLRRGL